MNPPPPSFMSWLAEQAPVIVVLIVVLIVVIWYFYQRDKRNDTKADAREAQCEKRNTDLTARIEKMEAQNGDKCRKLLEAATSALNTNADTFNQWTNRDTPALIRKSH